MKEMIKTVWKLSINISLLETRIVYRTEKIDVGRENQILRLQRRSIVSPEN